MKTGSNRLSATSAQPTGPACTPRPRTCTAPCCALASALLCVARPMPRASARAYTSLCAPTLCRAQCRVPPLARPCACPTHPYARLRQFLSPCAVPRALYRAQCRVPPPRAPFRPARPAPSARSPSAQRLANAQIGSSPMFMQWLEHCNSYTQ